jgi:hypothetical protein
MVFDSETTTAVIAPLESLLSGGHCRVDNATSEPIAVRSFLAEGADTRVIPQARLPSETREGRLEILFVAAWH